MQFRPYHAALLSGLGVWSLRISAKGGPFLLIVCIVERLLPFGTLAFAEFPAYSQVFHEDFAPWSLSLRNCAIFCYSACRHAGRTLSSPTYIGASVWFLR